MDSVVIKDIDLKSRCHLADGFNPQKFDYVDTKKVRKNALKRFKNFRNWFRKDQKEAFSILSKTKLTEWSNYRLFNKIIRKIKCYHSRAILWTAIRSWLNALKLFAISNHWTQTTMLGSESKQRFLIRLFSDNLKVCFNKILKFYAFTPVDKVNNLLVTSFTLKMAARSEAKSAKRSFASKE